MPEYSFTCLAARQSSGRQRLSTLVALGAMVAVLVVNFSISNVSIKSIMVHSLDEPWTFEKAGNLSSSSFFKEQEQSIPLEVIRQQRPTPSRILPERIFTCGWFIDPFLPVLFPDVNATLTRPLTRADISKNGTTERDLLVFGMHGPCDGEKDLGHAIIQKSFAGKALFYNAEPYGDARGHNTYQIGLVPASNRSLFILSVAVYVAVQTPKEIGDRIFVHKLKKKNTRRLGLIYFSGNCVSYREEAVDQINALNIDGFEVHYGGKCRGKSKKLKKTTVNQTGIGWDANWKLYHDYRYCIAMDNRKIAGYISEKIANAFMGGCVPIYYGTTEVFDIFNKDAFIYYDIGNPTPALVQIRYLEQNRTAYDEMLAQPILANGTDTIEKYFSLRYDLGQGKLLRNLREMMGYDPNPGVIMLPTE